MGREGEGGDLAGGKRGVGLVGGVVRGGKPAGKVGVSWI